jgi:hypothetical protein
LSLAFIGNRLYALLVGGVCSHLSPESPNVVIKLDVAHGTSSYVANLSAFLKTHPFGNPAPSDDDRGPDGTWYGIVAGAAIAT